VKKRLLLPLLLLGGTFAANLLFDINIMLLVLIDGLFGLLFLRDSRYN